MNLLIVLLLVLSMFAPYIGSWLPSLAGSPAGGLARDFTILVFIIGTLFVITKSLKVTLMQASYLIAWSVLSCWMAILAVTGGQISSGILGARNLIIFPLVGLLVSINIRKSVINYSTVKNCIFVLGGLAAVLGILDVITNGKVLIMLGYNDEYAEGSLFNLVVEYLGFRRASAGLSDSLNYGYTMSLFAVYFIYCLTMMKSCSKFKIILVCLLALLSSVAVILSLTRGAILVLIIGIMLFAIRYGSRRVKIAFAAFIVSLIIVASSTVYSGLLYGRFTDSEKVSERSSQSRIDMAKKSMVVIINNPFGIGLGTQGAGTKYISDDMRVNSDNFFFWILVESGFMGFTLLLVTLILNYIICFRYVRKDKPKLLLCVYMLIAYVITGMLSAAQISPLYSIFYWIIINIEAANTSLPVKSIRYVKKTMLTNA
ncbi:MAG: O-antigen ligase family protein [Paludibacteraceae bacterium]